MPKVIEAAVLPSLIKGHKRVFIQGGVGEPSTLINTLSNTQKLNEIIEYVSVSIPGINRFAPSTFHPQAEFTSFFLHRDVNASHNNPIHFHPLHYRDIYRFLEASGSFDVALIQLSPPDQNGECSLGVSVDFVPAVIDKSAIIIAEINPQMPACPNSPSLPYATLNYVVNCDHPLVEVQSAATNPTFSAIAKHVAALLDDSSCIQIGIGKLPGVILNELKQHRHLGLHSGMMTPEVKMLIDLGVMTGEHKTLNRHEHVTGSAYGDQNFYQEVAAHPNVLFRPVNYTHDTRVIGAIENFVSINSVLELDLFGQANAEILNGRQISATGGLVDYIRGARISKNGKSILTLPASTLNSGHSRIKPHLYDNAVVSVSRADIDYVVTEYGIAHLFNQSVEKRAQALIDIAAPEYRSGLWEQWESGQTKASIS